MPKYSSSVRPSTNSNDSVPQPVPEYQQSTRGGPDLTPQKITANPAIYGQQKIAEHERKKASFGPVVEKAWTKAEEKFVRRGIGKLLKLR